ncbi:MAG: hypothetical protein ACK555_00055, partial [Acidobacteriota bacterium]
RFAHGASAPAMAVSSKRNAEPITCGADSAPPRHCNGNGLAETKNHWEHIASEKDDALDEFLRVHLNPDPNFHRPRGVPQTRTLANGKIKRLYRWCPTPWEILRKAPELTSCLRAHLSIPEHEEQARTQKNILF